DAHLLDAVTTALTRTPSALMVRSRNLGSTQTSQSRARRLEPWGRPIIRDGRYAILASRESASVCALLRMRRINPQRISLTAARSADSGPARRAGCPTP